MSQCTGSQLSLTTFWSSIQSTELSHASERKTQLLGLSPAFTLHKVNDGEDSVGWESNKPRENVLYQHCPWLECVLNRHISLAKTANPKSKTGLTEPWRFHSGMWEQILYWHSGLGTFLYFTMSLYHCYFVNKHKHTRTHTHTNTKDVTVAP